MRRSVVVAVVLAWTGIARADDVGLLDLTEDERAWCANQPDDGICAQVPAQCEARTFLPHGVLARICLARGIDAPADLTPGDLDSIREACATDRANCARMTVACRENAALGFPASNLADGCAIVEATLHVGLPQPMPKGPPPAPGISEVWAGVEVGGVADRGELETEATIAGAVDMHGLMGLARTGGAAFTHLALGSTTNGGFLYALDVGFGLGVRLGDDGFLSLTIGGGFSGITGGRLGFAWEVPVDAFVGVPLGASLRLLAGARGSWVFREDPRQDGSPVSLFDETSARLGVAWMRGARPGFALTAFASELHDTRIAGVSLAIGQVEVTRPE